MTLLFLIPVLIYVGVLRENTRLDHADQIEKGEGTSRLESPPGDRERTRLPPLRGLTRVAYCLTSTTSTRPGPLPLTHSCVP